LSIKVIEGEKEKDYNDDDDDYNDEKSVIIVPVLI